MTSKRTSWISAVSGVFLLTGTVTACSKTAEPSGDLARDLNAAASNAGSAPAPAITLAPTSGSRDVVSAIEQSPDARRANASPKAKSEPQRPEVSPPPAAKEPVPITAAPTTAVAAAPPATSPPSPASPTSAQPSPSRRPTQMQPAQTGRYKTEAEVIRDAPFPIKP